MAHTLTVYADTTDDEVFSDHGTYTTAADGGGTLALRGSTETAQVVGQQKPGDYYCHEAFESFDTSSLADSGITITGADLSIYPVWNPTETAWTLQARAFDWGTSVTTGDFRTRAQLSDLTLLASLGSGSLGTGAYRTLSSETDFLSAISQTGTTRIVLCSNRHVAGTAPTNYELLSYSTADASGTTQDPKLVITYTVQNTATLTATSSAVGGLTRGVSLVRSASSKSRGYINRPVRDAYRVAFCADTHFCDDAARRSAYGMGVKSAQNVAALGNKNPDAYHHLGDIVDYMPSEWEEAGATLDGLNLYACLGTHDYDIYRHAIATAAGFPSDLWDEVALTLASPVTGGTTDTITVSEAVTDVVVGHGLLIMGDILDQASGTYELLTVDSVNTGAKTITFTGNVVNSYSAGAIVRQGYSNQRGIDYMLAALSNTPTLATRNFYTVGNLLFIFLSLDRWHPDASGFSRNLWAANDLDWLEAVVAAGDANNYNIIINTHMAPSAETGTYDWEPSIVYWPESTQARFKAICANYTVAMWCSGHAHTSQVAGDGQTNLTNGVSGWGNTYFYSAPATFQQYADYEWQGSFLNFYDGSSTAVLKHYHIDSDGNIDADPFRTQNVTLPYAVDLTPRGAAETYQDGDYTVHKFTTSGTLLCPDGFYREAEILVVGGGGGGGQGGGGGGGYTTDSDVPIQGAMSVVVGEGGISSVGFGGVNGGPSSFAGYQVKGGGGGGYGVDPPGTEANGGGGAFSGSITTTGGTGDAWNGGGNAGYTGAPYPAGGGGGAGGNGGNATSNSAAGVGGAGVNNSITGASVGYAGGGGGGLYGDGTPGSATHGGGAGGDEAASPAAGTDGRGGGGGGGTNATGGARGGDGVVIIRYLTPVIIDSELPAIPLAVPYITRQVGAIRSTTSTPVPVLSRAIALTRSATASAVASIAKTIPVLLTLEAVASATASLSREVGKIAAVTASAVATRQIAVGRSLSAVSSATGAMTRGVSKVLSSVSSAVSSATAEAAIVARYIVKPLKSGLAYIKNISGVASIRAVTGSAIKRYISGEVDMR